MAPGDSGVRVLFTADQIARRVSDLAAAIARDFPEERSAPRLWLVGALKGATFFLADLARAIPRAVSIDFVQASSYGDSAASSGNVRILRDIDNDIAGDDVVLVEDIVDSGRTANRLLRFLEARKPRRLRLAALLEKPARRVERVTIDYRGFEIPDAFVVGYGLDYAERYRSLPEICILEERTRAQP